MTRTVGAVVLIASLGAAVWLAVNTDAISTFHTSWPDVGVAILFGALLYVVCDLLLAVAWTTGFRAIGSDRPTFCRGLVVFGQTNLYRYLPSNIMHFVGRQVWLPREGLSHRDIALISVWESASLVVIAAIIGFASMLNNPLGRVSWTTAPPFIEGWPMLAAIAAAASVLALLWISSRRSALSLARRARCAATSATLYLAFFCVAGMIVWLILRAIAESTAGLIDVIGLSTLAWIVGFLTPGASAGLGVREGVLVATLMSFTSIEMATITAVGFRASFIWTTCFSRCLAGSLGGA